MRSEKSHPKERAGDVRVVNEHAAHRLLVVVDHGLRDEVKR